MGIHIITHNRVHHADEVLATSIIKLAYQGQEVKVTRTRDPEMLKKYAGMDGAFLLDVGGIYDPQLRLFDHHQQEGAGYRDWTRMEWPYATAGLVWGQYGHAAVANLHPDLVQSEVREVVRAIDDTVLKYVDAVDCGVRFKNAGPSLSGIIASFNVPGKEADPSAFPLVCDLAQVLLTNFINRQAGTIRSRVQVRSAQQLEGGQVLVLQKCIPWSQVVSEEMPEVKMVVYPTGTNWQVRMAMENNLRQTNRITLPSAWGGLENESLVSLTGVQDSVFCHRSGHLAVAKSFEGIMAMVRKVLSMQGSGPPQIVA